jgi:hypothetical protein
MSFGRFGRVPLLGCTELTRSESADADVMSSRRARSIDSNRVLAACSHFLRAAIRLDGRSGRFSMSVISKTSRVPTQVTQDRA